MFYLHNDYELLDIFILVIKVNKEGYVTLIMDLGAGAQTITSEVPVIYNDWIKIQVKK